MILTDSVLRGRSHERVPCSGMGTRGKEFIDLVGIFVEDSFEVNALDCNETVLDEKGVGLPILRTGAAICRCEVLEAV